ncbi:13117_t:CDS:1, partial [Ambispora gerdemannii]
TNQATCSQSIPVRPANENPPTKRWCSGQPEETPFLTKKSFVGRASVCF